MLAILMFCLLLPGMYSSPQQSTVTLQCKNEIISNITIIQDKLYDWNHTLTMLFYESAEAEWRWNVNITSENEILKTKVSEKLAVFAKELWRTVACFDCDAAGCSDEERRRIRYYQNIGEAALPAEAFNDYLYLTTTMTQIYSTGKICPPENGVCLEIEPDIYNLMSESSDYCTLEWAWHAWRNETGRKMGGYFMAYALLLNEASKLNGFNNAKEMWTDSFLADDASYFEQMQQAWKDVLPLYEQLHAYVRRKLRTEKYAAFADQFPSTGHIPAHLLSNMWAQDWTGLYKLLVPYPNASVVDLTAALQENNYTILDIFRESERFFHSMGLPLMTEEFWNNSVFEAPADNVTEMVCHASAWDFYTKTDFRIKMCTQINEYDFQTVHHEMGHIQYFMAYKDKHVEFRDGANDGFHEAIGDLIALSAMTPGHLKAVGLLPSDFVEDEKTSLNTLMRMAIEKVAFLPFGYLVDKYRWGVFDKTIPFSRLNEEWWRLRCSLQGVSPPVARSEDDFDPGAKFHVAASVPYDRYFYAFILQFQIHRALCQRMGLTSNFHQCDIYGQENATKVLREALELGSSRPYPEVLQLLTGSSKLDSTAILDYFAPLYSWLKEQNQNETVGWTNECPTVIPTSPCNQSSLVLRVLRGV